MDYRDYDSDIDMSDEKVSSAVFRFMEFTEAGGMVETNRFIPLDTDFSESVTEFFTLRNEFRKTLVAAGFDKALVERYMPEMTPNDAADVERQLNELAANGLVSNIEAFIEGFSLPYDFDGEVPTKVIKIAKLRNGTYGIVYWRDGLAITLPQTLLDDIWESTHVTEPDDDTEEDFDEAGE